jgi:inner membrane protein
VDPITHGLASYVLKRAAFPRLARPVTLAMMIAGTIADIDGQSARFGPSAFLTFYRTCFHSLPAAVLFSVVATLPFLLRRPPSTEKQTPPAIIFVAALSASVFHLLMDICQTAGVELFWPFSPRRFALDWVAHLDLWILGILLAGVFLPALSGLVTDEIGAKSKGPKGSLGASVALAVLPLYFGARSILHSNALVAVQSRAYRGESPRRTAVLAESGSPFRWQGVVETESALHEVEVELGQAAKFDPDSARTSYKPEPSPSLDAARNTAVAHRFLQAARFPKASVEKTPGGFHITLRDFPYTRDIRSGLRVQATIETDPAGKVLSQQLYWNPLSRELWWE